MYQAEISDNRKLLDGLDKDKASLEIKVTSLGEQLREANVRWVIDLRNASASINGVWLAASDDAMFCMHLVTNTAQVPSHVGKIHE